MDGLKVLFCFLSAFLIVSIVSPLPKTIYIGGLFDIDDEAQIKAFNYAVERVNSNHSLQTEGSLQSKRRTPWSKIQTKIERFSTNDSFEVTNRVCSLMSKGVAAIFGPTSPTTAPHVQSICDTLAVPHIETRRASELEYKMDSINVYPNSSSLNQAYVDLVRAWNWTRFAIVYDDNEALVRLRYLFETKNRGIFNVTLRQMPPDGDYRTIFRQIRREKQFQIIIDCDTKKIFTVLKQAQQVGMMTENHEFLVTSLDLNTVDLEDFRYSGTRITSFRLIDPKRQEVSDVMDFIKMLDNKRQKASDSSEFMMTTETALIFDAIHLFATAIHILDASQPIEINPLSCEDEKPWEKSGISLTNYMKWLEVTGLSGIVGRYDYSEFILDIMSLYKTEFIKIGWWNSTEKANNRVVLDPSISYEEEIQNVDHIKNQHFNITILMTEPYAMNTDSGIPLEGNARYEGFCIDLITEMAKILGFKYTFYEVPDKQHGKEFNLSGVTSWNGVIGEVINKNADLGIGDITITKERERVVDFTTPFMNLGLSILFKKPERAPPSFLSFLAPFSNDVWLYMCITYMGVSVTLFILARLSPDEWDNPYPCIQEPDVLKNDFGMINSMWFTIGSLMQQGSDIAPKAASTRLVAGMWWLFTLIMISSYTATLTAFLTVETLDSPIKNVDDLAGQTTIKYGCQYGGATYEFFEKSQTDLYKKMYNFMLLTEKLSNGSVFTTSPNANIKGEKLVKKGNYAYFMESNGIEYIAERDCSLTQIGGLLDSKGYGIALLKGSQYRNDLSRAVLKLQENGRLQALKTIWWKQKRGGGKCRDSSSNAPKALGLPNVSGIFVVLLGGMIISSFAAFMEFFWKTRQVPRGQRESLCKEMLKEMKFAMSGKNSKKVQKKTSLEPENMMTLPLGKYGYGDGDRDIFT